MPSSPEQMAQSMIANMQEKTGKTLEEWLTLAKRQTFEKHGQWVKWLKADYQVTHGFANLIAHTILQPAKGESSVEDLVEAQYSGAKQGLRSIYDRLLVELKHQCPELEVSPKKAYVSLRRKKQFAIIQPSTKTRVDVGINLKDTAANERLEVSGSFNAMVSHRVRVTEDAQIDKQLLDWLVEAYKQA